MASRIDPEPRALTAEALARLLSRLGDDPERAGQAYETLRRALVKFFDWRGASRPDECADETLDRLARKLDEGTSVDDPQRFAHGIARLVLFESWRRPEARARLANESVLERLPAPVAPEPETDPRAACFHRCLAELPSEGRELILGYYSAEGGRKIEARKRMAESLRLSENALRSRAQRLRDRLERCIVSCRGAWGDTKR